MQSSAEMKLLDFPDEILLEIFRNLSDQSLMVAVNVCKRFKTIAGASFARKYSGVSADTFYALKVFGDNCTDEQKQYQPVFRCFGGYMKAIHIEFGSEAVAMNHWLIRLIKCYGKSITKVKISHGEGIDLLDIVCNLPSLMDVSLENVKFLNNEWTQFCYPKLTSFSARDSGGNHNKFVVFIDRNPQLEHLSLIRFVARTNDIIHSISDKLHNLKTLMLVGEKTSFTRAVSISPMDSLVSLTVLIDRSSFVPFLTAIRYGLNKMEELNVDSWRRYELRPQDVDLLCSFNMLKKLELHDAFQLSEDLLKVIILRLTNLVSFSLGDAQNLFKTPDDLLNVVFVCRNLSLLQLDIVQDEPTFDYSFCTRFADIMDIHECNLKMELLFNETDKTVFTRDEAYRYIERGFAEEEVYSRRTIYWKGYNASDSSKINFLELSKEVLTKVFHFLDGNAILTLFQSCKRLQQFVIEYMSENEPFSCYVTPMKCTKENVFIVLGNYIRRIKLNMEHDTFDDDDDDDVQGTKSNELKTKFLECVNQYSGNSIMQMEVKSCVQIRSILYWPNLTKLKFSSIDNRKLQLFYCPQLTHLNVEYFGNVTNIDWTTHDFFPSLTSLTFGCYSESVVAFLCGLSDGVCNQMQHLCINGSFKKNQCRNWLKLTNIVCRFGHLVALHLNVDGVAESNFRLLFENCPSLVELTICGEGFEDFYFGRNKILHLFRAIKQNCNQLKVIRLTGTSTNFDKELLERIHLMFPNVVFV